MPSEPWDPVERDKRYKNAKADGLTRLMSEGDSWFDYPPHPNIVDWLEAEGRWAIKRLERSGDTAANMASETNLALMEALAKREGPVAFLFSGGGNDLFTEIPERPDLRWIYRALVDHAPGMTTAESHVNRFAWEGKKNDIRGSYLRVLERVSPFAPVLMHGYDYLIASGNTVLYDGFRPSGPWILPSMRARRIMDDALQRDILALLIDEFNAMLATLQRNHPDDIILLTGASVPIRRGLLLAYEGGAALSNRGRNKGGDQYSLGLDYQLPLAGPPHGSSIIVGVAGLATPHIDQGPGEIARTRAEALVSLRRDVGVPSQGIRTIALRLDGAQDVSGSHSTWIQGSASSSAGTTISAGVIDHVVKLIGGVSGSVSNLQSPLLASPRPAFGYHSTDLSLALDYRRRDPLSTRALSATLGVMEAFRAARLGSSTFLVTLRGSILFL